MLGSVFIQRHLVDLAASKGRPASLLLLLVVTLVCRAAFLHRGLHTIADEFANRFDVLRFLLEFALPLALTRILLALRDFLLVPGIVVDLRELLFGADAVVVRERGESSLHRVAAS